MSTAKSLTEDSKPSGRSLMYIRKSNGPNIEPCGTPASNDDQLNNGHQVPLSETYYLKKLLRRLRRFPDIPICSCLNSNPSCHTLSNVLDISRKFALISMVGI